MESDRLSRLVFQIEKHSSQLPANVFVKVIDRSKKHMFLQEILHLF